MARRRYSLRLQKKKKKTFVVVRKKIKKVNIKNRGKISTKNRIVANKKEQVRAVKQKETTTKSEPVNENIADISNTYSLRSRTEKNLSEDVPNKEKIESEATKQKETITNGESSQGKLVNMTSVYSLRSETKKNISEDIPSGENKEKVRTKPKAAKENENRTKAKRANKKTKKPKRKKSILVESIPTNICGTKEYDAKNKSFDENTLVSYDRNKSKIDKNTRPFRSSFERYGIILPTQEEILEAKRKLSEEKRALDAYDLEYGDLTDSSFVLPNTNNNESYTDLLDCEHLTEENLKEYLEKNLEYLQNIFDGRSDSIRHKKFQNYDPNIHLTMNDLTYSSSILVFNENQRDFLFRSMESYFDPEMEKTDYLFKVLLPEICLKIFMDCYEMTKEKAEEYLDWRPVDCVFL